MRTPSDIAAGPAPGSPRTGARGGLCHPADRAAQQTPLISTRSLVGVLAVLLGSIISTLDSRITNFGLADVRGAVHAGFDEGAWITTAFTVGQMMIGLVSAWLGMVLGPRRLLMISTFDRRLCRRESGNGTSQTFTRYAPLVAPRSGRAGRPAAPSGHPRRERRGRAGGVTIQSDAEAPRAVSSGEGVRVP